MTDPKPDSPSAPEAHDANDDALGELPPLDDDGSLFDGEDDDAFGIDHDRHRDGDAHALDDGTGERDPIDAWVSAEMREEGGLLDDGEPDESIAPDEDVSLGGDERGLLEGSDEGDGRDVGADEAGIFSGDETPADDGGAEGTGEDPSSAIDQALLRDPLTVGAPEDDEIAEETLYNAPDFAGDVESREREPWPSRADVAWAVERVSSRAPKIASKSEPAGESQTVTATEGDLVAAARFGEGLALSFDRGERFVSIAGCASATTVATIPGAPRGLAVVAALWDPMKDASSLVVVRLVQGTPVAEIVADLARGEDDAPDDDRARVTALEVEVAQRRIVVHAFGRFGVLRVTG
jgi:hypothetical protein